ncbi:hypothetical protein [Halobacillus sp. B23F22_1]|uniref:hypothetical protein n=1 Tax=Halobacillus sp. B23F22_1 TaxID=3459514 RepID=UPI00373EF71B
MSSRFFESSVLLLQEAEKIFFYASKNLYRKLLMPRGALGSDVWSIKTVHVRCVVVRARTEDPLAEAVPAAGLHRQAIRGINNSFL